MTRLLFRNIAAFVLTGVSAFAAAETGKKNEGRVCVDRTVAEPPASEAGAFQPRSGGTPAAVRIQIDKSEKKAVSPKNSAMFTGLNVTKSHSVSIYDATEDKRLVSFYFKFPQYSVAMCLERKPTYGTWAIEPCRCGDGL